MNRTAKDRILENLPPEQRSYFDRCLHRLSTNPDDPLIALFAIIIESDNQNTAAIEAKLAVFELQEKNREVQYAKDRTETQKTIKGGFQDLTGDKPWRRGIIKSVVNGIVWGISVVASTVGIVLILLATEIFPLREVIREHQKITKTLADDPASLAAYAKYSKEANSEALSTAKSLHAMSKLMAIPKMQILRSDDGFLTFYAPESFMPVGTTKNGLNWFKLGDIQAMMRADTTLSIDKAIEAKKKLEKK